MNIDKLMKQAKLMQETLAALEVEGVAGGGSVRATLSGTRHLVRLQIDPAAAEPGDVTLLEDLVLAAVHDAERRLDEKIAGQVGGGLPFPG